MKPSDIPHNQEIVLFECNQPYKMAGIFVNPTKNSPYLKIKQCAYKTKPHKRTILVEYDDEPVPIPQLIQIPELLFITDFMETYCEFSKIKCYHQSKLFIVENNQLFYSNMLNVDPMNALICWGDVNVKGFNKIKSVKELINLFWNSKFNFSYAENESYDLEPKIIANAGELEDLQLKL